MFSYKDRCRGLFSTIVIVIVCAFLPNDAVFVLDSINSSSNSALAPASIFNPIVSLKWDGTNNRYFITENQEEKSRFKYERQEEAAFVYLNLLIGQFQRDLSDLSKLGVSDRGLKKHLEEIKKDRLSKFIESIKEDLPHINFDRFRLNEMYWDCNTVCLQYDGQILRYSLPEEKPKETEVIFMPPLEKLHSVDIFIGVSGDEDILEDPAAQGEFMAEWVRTRKLPAHTFQAITKSGEDFEPSSFNGNNFELPNEFIAENLPGDNQGTPLLCNPYRLSQELIEELKLRAFLRYKNPGINVNQVIRLCREMFAANYTLDPRGEHISRLDIEIDILRQKCQLAAKVFVNPVRIYEVNVALKLNELRKVDPLASLSNILSDEKLSQLKASGYTHIWLMGEKERDLAAAGIALSAGKDGPSPYSLRSNKPDDEWGGKPARNAFIERLKKFSLAPAGDYVTNHFGFVSKFVERYPQLFIIRDKNDPRVLRDGRWEVNSDYWFDYDQWKSQNPDQPLSESLKGKVILRAQETRWDGGTQSLGTGDVAQVSLHNPDAIDIMTTLVDEAAAEVCLPDGQGKGVLRFDLAHYLWRDNLRGRVKDFLSAEELSRFDDNYHGIEPLKIILSRVKKKYPNLITVAEVYGGIQTNIYLLGLGFDFAYDKDKGFYDIVVARKDTRELNLHMRQLELMRRAGLLSLLFDENHDEISVNAAFPFNRSAHAAALFLRRLSGHAELMFCGEEEGRYWNKHNAEDRYSRNDMMGDPWRSQMYDHPLLRHSALLHGRRTPLTVLNGNGQEGSIAAYLVEYEGINYLGVVNISNETAKGKIDLDADSIFGNKSGTYTLKDIADDYNQGPRRNGYTSQPPEPIYYRTHEELKSLSVELVPDQVQFFEIISRNNAQVPDLDRERNIAIDFRDAIIEKAVKAKKDDQYILFGLDETWIKNKSGLQAIITELERLPENLRQRGLDNVIFKRGEGDEVADAIAREREGRESIIPLSNITVLGSHPILRSDKFNRLRREKLQDSALLIGVDNASFTITSGTRLLEMYLLALKLTSINLPDKSDPEYEKKVKVVYEAFISRLDTQFIQIAFSFNGQFWDIVFTPIKPYDINESAERNRIQIEQIDSKA